MGNNQSLNLARERLVTSLLSTDKIAPEHREAFMAFRDGAAETAIKLLGPAEGSVVAAAIYLHSACGIAGEGQDKNLRQTLSALYGADVAAVTGELLEKECKYKERIEGIGDLSPPARNAMLAVEIMNIRAKTADPSHPPGKLAGAIAFSRVLLDQPEMGMASGLMRSVLGTLVGQADKAYAARHGERPSANPVRHLPSLAAFSKH